MERAPGPEEEAPVEECKRYLKGTGATNEEIQRRCGEGEGGGGGGGEGVTAEDIAVGLKPHGTLQSPPATHFQLPPS